MRCEFPESHIQITAVSNTPLQGSSSARGETEDRGLGGGFAEGVGWVVASPQQLLLVFPREHVCVFLGSSDWVSGSRSWIL